MISIFSIIFYVLAFMSVYVQVFLLLTFIENRKKIVVRKGEIKLKKYHPVTVIVPCWNEEKTIYKTVRSLLDLNYPQDKLKIFLVDDGSTDGTLHALNKFSHYPNITVFQKENGGKHTALNFGLEKLETDFVGCLDADSFADKNALTRIMSYFEKDSSIMAVAPSVMVSEPKSIIQKAQKAEYYLSVYVKKMLAFLGAIHVTPGPLTIFKRKVFDDLGPYRSAHNTEDMEIAYRMQTNHYKIEQCNDAYVYTNTPSTVSKLYKQRLRWIYGFINNTIDYRKFLLKRKYGNFSLFTVPAGILSVVAVSYLFFKVLFTLGNFLVHKFTEYKIIGLDFSPSVGSFDPFFISSQAGIFVSITLYSLVIFSIVLGHKMAKERWSFPVNILYFFFIYSVVAPFWLMRAILNTAVAKKPSWR